ncbi:hypothetical protein GOP47_0003312 [Adiantum capillus-veneris]|uniref:Uncharacterized protein n=1 Tax=Adiantum capillus-veneris TaxID=13818 RepID=A0A9D4VCJ6_ADICA|nr:hypothetical protein GOP47_0003312 [Adiantum capillus-veneris]
MAVVANLASPIQKPLGHSQPINGQNAAPAATLYSCNEAPSVLGALQEPKTATSVIPSSIQGQQYTGQLGPKLASQAEAHSFCGNPLHAHIEPPLGVCTHPTRHQPDATQPANPALIAPNFAVGRAMCASFQGSPFAHTQPLMADDVDADDTAIQAFLESLAAEEPTLVKSIHARPLEVATHQAASHAPEASQQLALEAAMPTFSQGCPVAAIRLRHSSPHVDAPTPTVPFAGPKYQFDPALGASFYAANSVPPLKSVAAKDDAATIEVFLAFLNTSFKAYIFGHTASASVPTKPCYDETSLNATPTDLLQATLDASSNPISKLDLFDAYIVVPLSPEHHFHSLPVESLFYTDSQAAATPLSCFPLTLTNAQALRAPGKSLLPWISINFDPGGEASHGRSLLPTNSHSTMLVLQVLTSTSTHTSQVGFFFSFRLRGRICGLQAREITHGVDVKKSFKARSMKQSELLSFAIMKSDLDPG